MRVKFLSVFLALVLILGLLPACSKPEEDDGEKPLTGYDDEADLSAPSANDEDYIYLHDRDYQSLSDMRAQLQFDYISGGDILDAYAEQGEAAQSHPRVFVDSDKLQSLREEMETSERLQSLYSSVKRRADEVLNLATPTYDDNDPDRLTAVHTYGPGLMDAAFYYTLNPDRANKESEAYTKYFQKSLEYVKVICNFKDWHIVHALDTFVATASIGIYYDVMYEYLSEEDRTLIRNAIIDKGILPYISSAASDAYTASNEDELIGAAGNHWSTYVNNWNGVCNGGFLTGALAIFGDDTSKISNEVLSRAMAKSWNNTSHLIRSYYPDGVSEEGYMYWEYALMYLELGWLGFDNMLGTTFGWMEYEVMEKLAYGSMYESGPVVGSNVGDDTVKTNPSSTRISLAYLLDKGDVQQYRFQTAREDKLTWREMVCYQSKYDTGEEVKVDTYGDYYVRGLDNVNLRSGYDSDALFASIHAGVNNASHGHLDAGQFDLQGNGVVFVYGSLGRDDYNLVPGYFNTAEVPAYDGEITGTQTQAVRNNIYRIRTESKSAVVIKPGRNRSDIRQEQSGTGAPVVERILSRDKGSFTTIDMTNVYSRDVVSYKRGMKMRKDLNMVTLQDEIVLKDASYVYWSVNLSSVAEVTISEDKRSALVKVADELMYVELANDIEAEFTLSPCEYLPNEQFPLTTNQTSNNFQKLMLTYTGRDTEVDISVNFIMLDKWETEPSFVRPGFKKMADWNIPTGEIPAEAEKPVATEIKVDGTAIPDFDPQTEEYVYTIPLEQEESPVLTVTAESGATVKTEVRGLDYGFVYVTKDDVTRVYSIKFVPASSPSTAEDLTPHIIDVTCSSYQLEGNRVPENTLDGNLDIESRWSAEGAQWIQYELDDVYEVSFLSLVTWNSNTRQMVFNIEVSEDGKTYIRLFEENITTNGITAQTDFETFKFTKSRAKYVKILCYGTTQGSWNSIIETKLYGKTI